MDQQDIEQITQDLGSFIGTTEYHRWSILFRNMFLTDGADYLAKECGAYWLMDLIASHQKYQYVKAQTFQVWTLTKLDRGAQAICDDGNGKRVTSQFIEYTDFPLPEIKLYAGWENGQLVIMLPGEY